MPNALKNAEFSPSISILLAGALIAGAILFTNYYSPAQAVVPADVGARAAEISIKPPSPEDHWFGSPTASIVFVEYSDFQCPFCASIHPSLKRIVEESDGEVAWVYRHFPLESIHPEARPSAIAAECVAEQLGSEGFWAFADAAFENQRALGNAFYTQTATALGVDQAAFSSCLLSGAYDEKVDREYTEALQNGGGGTPFTVVVAGDIKVPLSGALPYEQLKAVITAVQGRQ